MDWNRVEGNWKQLKGKVKEKWGKLTDDDLTAINGHRDQLEGKIRERYGLSKDQARKEIDDWYRSQSALDWPGRRRVLITNSPGTNLTKPLQYDPKI